MGLFANKKLDQLDFVVTQRERNRFTPDIGKLQDAQFHLMFVYDRLQQGFDDHKAYMEEHVVRAAGAFSKESFVMYKKHLGLHTYPLIQRRDNAIRDPALRVKGELYYIETEQIRELDRLRQNGVEFQRELVEILVPYSRLMKLPSWRTGGKTQAEYEAVYDTKHPSVHVAKMCTVKAFAYVGINEFWDDLVDDWHYSSVSQYEAHNRDIGKYYSFTKRDYIDD